MKTKESLSNGALGGQGEKSFWALGSQPGKQLGGPASTYSTASRDSRAHRELRESRSRWDTRNTGPGQVERLGGGSSSQAWRTPESGAGQENASARAHTVPESRGSGAAKMLPSASKALDPVARSLSAPDSVPLPKVRQCAAPWVDFLSIACVRGMGGRNSFSPFRCLKEYFDSRS